MKNTSSGWSPYEYKISLEYTFIGLSAGRNAHKKSESFLLKNFTFSMISAYVYLTTSALSVLGSSFNIYRLSLSAILLALLFSKNFLIFPTILSGSFVRFAKPVNVFSFALNSLAFTSIVDIIDCKLPIVNE